MKQDLIEGGMPRDAKSVQEALLAAASQGEGSQLKKTFAAWRQDTNFVFADAVYEGDVGKLQLLTNMWLRCGRQKGKVHPSGGGPWVTGVFREFGPEETILHEGQ